MGYRLLPYFVQTIQDIGVRSGPPVELDGNSELLSGVKRKVLRA
jgi:hypothetical protein